MFDEHVFFFSYSKNAISYKAKKSRNRTSSISDEFWFRDGINSYSRGATRIESRKASLSFLHVTCAHAPAYLLCRGRWLRAAGSGVFRYQTIAQGILSVGDMPFLSKSELL